MSDQLELLETPEKKPAMEPEGRADASVREGARKATAGVRKPIVFEEEPEEEPSLLQRYRIVLIAGVLVVGGGLYLGLSKPSGPSAPTRKAPEPVVVKVQLPPPPPPPPPKLPPPPPKTEKPAESAQVPKAEPKPQPPAEKPPEGLGTNNKGPGPGMAGLGTSGNGMIGGTGGAGAGGNAAAWYASRVQSKITEALRNHRKTRSAKFRTEVQVWPDATGRLARVQLAGSTGDPAMDSLLSEEVLVGLQLEPPPQGIKPPIRLRLTLNRPN